MTAVEETVVMDSSGSAAATFSPLDATKPLVDATHTVYEKVAGSVEWYFEHWVDLFEEIKAEQAVRLPGLDLANVMVALGDAAVASDIPGRARLRLPVLRKRSDLCAQVAEAVKATPGVDAVHVSAITGSILVFYDGEEHRSLDALLHAIGA
ncbi:MAG TPA: hypothetical protein PKM78_16325 [Anaerolineae bacterium]|nr:hypothetical protein [Anaerolineae bacterium]HNU05662.1 hypothetical protein [Anaerolineae bacterium]